eukprot:TRINITY_DN6378_c0_g3_i2.p1 TRINITY_DN6378_c0_g3~~TRINITY_DN6378_c0_g3_i2.p1  ORF type:complete len:978 (+),score=201.30 TRINITY_DN6378_c0_g3_i2:57-2990(+)
MPTGYAKQRVRGKSVVAEKIKVVTRIRPHSSTFAIRADGNSVVEAGSEKRAGPFFFDHVFDEKATNKDIYSAVVKDLVGTWVDGYHACVFAYGQTGSGKTHTMLGRDGGKKDLDGIIPQVADTVFHAIAQEEKALAALGALSTSQYQVRASYVEVYNNDVRDLLATDGDPQVLSIKEDRKGRVCVHGCIERPLEMTKDIINVIHEGAQRRATGRTNMNEHSSRSHAVLTLTLEHRWQSLDQQKTPVKRGGAPQFNTVTSVFNLVDLAGSEQSARTGNQGQAFRESVAINTGLLALGNVLASLAGDPGRGGEHVPYRDSPLTRILQSSLSGDSRTVMLTCVSPAEENFDNSIATLRYGEGGRRIQIAPKKTVAVEEGEADPLAGDVRDPNKALDRRCEWIETKCHGDVFARCVGRAKDPLILFVHGSGPENSSTWWNGLIHELSVTSVQQSYFYVAIDCPGYGRSEGDRQTIRSSPGEFLTDVTHSLGRVKAFAICGSSQGSCSTFNAVLENPSITEYIIVMDPVGHDVFRYKQIQQPSLLLFDTEDDGHPVKVGRWMRDVLPRTVYHEWNGRKLPYWHSDNMGTQMLKMFADFAGSVRNLMATAASPNMSISTRLASGLVGWCENGGYGWGIKQLDPHKGDDRPLLQPPSTFLDELRGEAEKEGDESGGKDEWLMSVDDKSGKVYYYNMLTGEVAWTPPQNATLLCDETVKHDGDGEDCPRLFTNDDVTTLSEQETDEQREERLKKEQLQDECDVCGQLLWQPQRVDSCRHVFCSICAQLQLVRFYKKCPVCHYASADSKHLLDDADHFAAIKARAPPEAVAKREDAVAAEEEALRKSCRCIVKYGNTASGSGGGETHAVKAFLSVHKLECGKKCKERFPDAIKRVDFDINPRYPKSAVKVTSPPFTLERTMSTRFPCNMTIHWKDSSLPPLTLFYTIRHDPDTTWYTAVTLDGGKPSTSVKKGVCLTKYDVRRVVL